MAGGRASTASDSGGIGRWDRDGHRVERAARDALDLAGLRVGDPATI